MPQPRRALRTLRHPPRAASHDSGIGGQSPWCEPVTGRTIPRCPQGDPRDYDTDAEILTLNVRATPASAPGCY